MAAAALLAALLAIYAYFFRGDFGRLSRIAGLPGAAHRRRRYRVRIVKTLLLFGGGALAALLLAGRTDTLVRPPPEFAPLVALAGGPEPDVARTVAFGGLAGLVLGGAWAWWRRRRGRPPAMLGDFSALLPRDGREAALAFAAALAAGVGEELFFRLALPLFAAQVTGSAALGVALATLLFGAAHRYQRWPGVMATTLAGLLFAAIYVLSGQLWLAIAAHAAVDVNALVVRPWIGGLLRAGED